MGDVRYRYQPDKPNDNRILRLAMLQAWGYSCYWCRRPRDFADVEIDHIIPQKSGQAVVDEGLLDQYLTPPQLATDFQLHAAHNLAPICGPCNKEKLDALLAGAPRFMTLLQKARTLQPIVERRVRAFHRSDQVTKALLAISVADIADPAVTKGLQALGPLVVHRLRSVAPDALTGPSNYDYSDPFSDQWQRVAVTLDEESRRARVILEDVYGCNLDDALRIVVEALDAAIEKRLTEDISRQFANRGHNYALVEDADGRRDISFTQIRFDREESSFVARGSFEADGSTLVGVDSNNDSGTAWSQGDAETAGTFAVRFWAGEDDEDLSTARIAVDDPETAFDVAETSLDTLARLYEEGILDVPDED